MNTWRLKILCVGLIMIVLGILHLSLVRFSIIVQHGALDTLLCIGRVIRLNTTESVDQVVMVSGQSTRLLSAGLVDSLMCPPQAPARH